ncbi:ATP-binding protein [Collinsella sp. AGMB00827]|uniref:ATP-binding protein n=1 Tax=Collinsella ureilytica TaxID=2869515 RepID=A0ABS7MLX4_9ACTN|nr:ATP-binding protein [Collinsella urealyticum]MBY4798100.1 ATP-binding protein [Collinsella urealyticum]
MSDQMEFSLALAADPALARLVRMTASNAGVLASLSVERVEDIRMAAEEAFIYACAASPGGSLTISFLSQASRMRMTFSLDIDELPTADEGDPQLAYVDLILGAVCDVYEKQASPATLMLELKADA